LLPPSHRQARDLVTRSESTGSREPATRRRYSGGTLSDWVVQLGLCGLGLSLVFLIAGVRFYRRRLELGHQGEPWRLTLFLGSAGLVLSAGWLLVIAYIDAHVV
jgi:hypothetical protein